MSLERPRFRPDIEGLRGAAILLVVAFHAGVPWLAGGFVGVDVFFVLSGFLITGLLARELADSGDVDLADFYRRRALRLLPAFAVVLLATLALTLWMYAPIDQGAIASNARSVAMHSGNIVFAQSAVDYHGASDNPLLHTWSLAVEEQFYIVWPLLFLIVGRFRRTSGSLTKQLVSAVAVAGVLSFVASLVVTRVAQPWAFFGMPTRIWEFALGGLASLALSRGSRPTPLAGTVLQVLGLGAIAVAALWFSQVTPYPGVAALLPTFGTVALLVGGERGSDGFVSRMLGTPALRWLGRVSYSWYLWHWPLVGLGAAIDWRIGVWGKLAWSAGALVLAALTHRFVEEPARRSDWFATRPQLANVGALVASFALALVAWAGMGVARRNVAPAAQQRFAAARNDGMTHDCWGSLLTNANAKCEFGDTTARTTVVLFGDSHAEHWLPAVDRLGHERHWKVVAMIKPACPVADIPELVNWRLKRRYSECTQWRRAMLDRIVALHPAIAILSSWDHYMPPNGKPNASDVTPAGWERGLRRTYGTLAAAGVQMVVIRGTPRPGFDVPSCLSRMASGAPLRGRPCVYDRATAFVPPAIAAQNAAARGLPRLAFVDVNDAICATAVWPVIQRGAIVFQDDGHLTATFSLATAPILGARIDRALSR